MSTVEIKYDCQPHDGTPGQAWDDFEERLLDVAAGRVDKQTGWSLADCFRGDDPGGYAPGAPALTGNATGPVQTSRRRRLKESYSLLIKHELDPDFRQYLHQNHFQNGPDAFQYLQGLLRKPVDRLQLKEMDKAWDAVTLLGSVGVRPNSIATLFKMLKALNAKRPAADRKTPDQIGDKILEEIFTTSKHFSTEALLESNAPVGTRKFEIVPPASILTPTVESSGPACA